MASKIAPTKRVVVPTLVPLEGFDASKMVRSDPVTNFVDVIQSFSMVLGNQSGQRTVNEMLKTILAKPADPSGFDQNIINLSKFSRVRWRGQPGTESIIAPLHIVVQMLMMHPSTKTRAIRAAAAQTSLRVASGDVTVVPQVQANAARLGGTHTQSVMQADILPANNGDRALTLIDRLPDGEAKTAMIMRELEAEREARKRREEAEFAALQRREEAEAETHKRQLVVYDEQIASIHRERHQKDLVYKKQIDEYNEDKKRRKVEELREQIDKASDEATRCALRARLEMTQMIPTETTFVVHTDRIQKPQRLQQQVLVNEANAIEYRFPAGTTLMDATLESRVTIREYVDRVYPAAKLSNDDFKTLGGIVAKKVQAQNPGDANLVMKKAVSGERYAPPMYFIRDLDGPPIDRIIEDFVKEHGVGLPGGKRKRDDETSGTIDTWFKKQTVVVGQPVP